MYNLINIWCVITSFRRPRRRYAIRPRILVINESLNTLAAKENVIEPILEKYKGAEIFCENMKNGLARFSSEIFDLVIYNVCYDLNYSEEQYTTLKYFREGNLAPVMILSNKEGIEHKKLAYEIGADDYIVKPYNVEEFLLRVNSLLRRFRDYNKKSSPRNFIGFEGLLINPAQRRVFVDLKEVTLSVREYELLYFLVQNQGDPMTYEQLYNEVWKGEIYTDSSSLRSMVKRLRKKLHDIKSNNQYIQTIHGYGYCFLPQFTFWGIST